MNNQIHTNQFREHVREYFKQYQVGDFVAGDRINMRAVRDLVERYKSGNECPVPRAEARTIIRDLITELTGATAIKGRQPLGEKKRVLISLFVEPDAIMAAGGIKAAKNIAIKAIEESIKNTEVSMKKIYGAFLLLSSEGFRATDDGYSFGEFVLENRELFPGLNTEQAEEICRQVWQENLPAIQRAFKN